MISTWFLFGIFVYAGSALIFKGVVLFVTHDFSVWKLDFEVDPAKRVGAARYFGIVLCGMGLVFYSGFLIWVLPKQYWTYLYGPMVLCALALQFGAIRFKVRKFGGAGRR